jgi:O-antigen/teichoic acid export membrane protein
MPIQIRASFWFLICAFLQKGISLITTPIFTRLLSVAEYGQYSVFSSWLTIITVFVSLNLYSGVYTQGLVKFEENRKEYSSSLQGLCLTLVSIWTVIYWLFHDFWNEVFSLTTIQMTAMLLMIWTTSVFNFWSVEQRVDYKYKKLVAVTIIVSLAKPLLGIILVLKAEDKVTARILSLAIVELFIYSWFFFVQIRRGKKFFSSKFWKHALMFNLPLIPHYLSLSVLSNTDRIMISRMIGTDEAGIYNLAYSVSLIMTMFSTALMQTIEPWMYKKIKAAQIEDLSKVAYPALLIIAGVNVALMALAPEVVSIFAPVEYRNAVWIIPPVTMSVYFMFAYTFFAVFEFYYQKTRYITIATLIGACLNIILNYIFIGYFGYYAAGYTTLVCYIIYSLLHYYFMRKICKKELNDAQAYSNKTLMTITFGFMVLGFVFLFSYTNNILRYSLIVILLLVLIIKRQVVIYTLKSIMGIKKSKNNFRW